MALDLSRLQTLLRRHGALIRKREALYAEMDAAYDAIARHYGFTCRGCEDNCCLTRFDHHTLVEVLALYEGFRRLADDRKRRVVQRAEVYCQALRTDALQGPPFRHLCPLNQHTRCLLYAERPMICRLHGIPHVLRHPRQGLMIGSGCHMLEASRQRPDGPRLDRTPLYAAMAGLEKALRQASGWEQPVRLTVAEMILGFTAPAVSPSAHRDDADLEPGGEEDPDR